MEEKKSYKADLEHRRPLYFAVSLLGVTALFVAILFIPFKSLSEWGEDFLDDYSVDLDLRQQDDDDMISAALPQEEKHVQEESAKINKVDETTELAPEQLTPVKQQEEEEATKEDETDEQPPINQNEDDPEVMRIVEQLPQYPGGMVEFMKWLTATLKYPDDALKRKIQGRVMISFIVNTDGSLTDFKLTKPAHELLNAEALRVVKMMPKWEPGKDKGKPCRSMVAIPVVFEI